MNATIDNGGRVVIPKAIRDELGLSPGVTVEVVARGGLVVLVPAATPLRLVKRGGGVVAEPAAPLPTLTAEEVRATLEASRR